MYTAQPLELKSSFREEIKAANQELKHLNSQPPLSHPVHNGPQSLAVFSKQQGNQ